MTNHAWQIQIPAIGGVGPVEGIAMTKEAFNDILQVLREADADLAGIQDRYAFFRETEEEDCEAATKTRKRLGQAYEALAGQPIEHLFD